MERLSSTVKEILDRAVSAPGGPAGLVFGAVDREGQVLVAEAAGVRALGEDPVVNDVAALSALREVWLRTCRSDPYYNPGYRTDRGDFEPVR